jgi:hypothetical protein
MKMEAHRKRWSDAEDQLLGTKSDRALARKLGRSVAAVKGRRHHKRIRFLKPWRPEDDKILGTRPDSQIARLLGRPAYTVGWRRRKLGIPYRRYERRPWSREELELLGVIPDAEVARQTGHPLSTVMFKRQQLGKPKPDQVMDYWQKIASTACRALICSATHPRKSVSSIEPLLEHLGPVNCAASIG